MVYSVWLPQSRLKKALLYNDGYGRLRVWENLLVIPICHMPPATGIGFQAVLSLASRSLNFRFLPFSMPTPHAHLFALPLTVMTIVWILSLLRMRWNWGEPDGRFKWLYFGSTLLFGGLLIGSLRPTNTWDLPTYLTLAVVALVFIAGKYARVNINPLGRLSTFARSLLVGLISSLLLVGFAFLLYQPYARWYGQGYNAFEFWKGDHTPFWSYVTHWGVFLFVIISWMFGKRLIGWRKRRFRH